MGAVARLEEGFFERGDVGVGEEAVEETEGEGFALVGEGGGEPCKGDDALFFERFGGGDRIVSFGCDRGCKALLEGQRREERDLGDAFESVLFKKVEVAGEGKASVEKEETA